MCFDLDSVPPIPPIAGAAVEHRGLELTASDGNRFTAFAALSAAPTGKGMLILPDVRGLHPYYEELALRFAEEGIDAVAIDWFGRTAGPGSRGEGFDHEEHIGQTTWAGMVADITAAAEWLRSDRRISTLFAVGFCFGGRAAFVGATLPQLSLAGVIGFYGWPVGPSRRNDMPAPADQTAAMRSPVLAIFGGADAAIPPDEVARFEEALRRSGVEHEVVTVPDAPHGFFDKKQAEFADGSADSWRRVLAFVRANA